MRAMFLCGVFLGLAACGGKHPKPYDQPKVDLPSRTTTVSVEPAGADSITITLTADGRILAGGRAWSLKELDGLLKAVVRREGPSVYASTVAPLRIDRAVPWIHVRWLADALARHFVHQVRFVYADAKLGEADVPCRISVVFGDPAEPTFVQVLRLRIVVDGKGRLCCGERTTEDPSTVSAWVAEAATRVRMEELSGIRSEIVPRNGTAWGTVAAVSERLRADGATDLQFAGGYIGPPEDARGVDPLPRAAPDLADDAADGSRDRGGMDVESVWPYAGPEVGSEWTEPDEAAIEEPEPVLPDDPADGK